MNNVSDAPSLYLYVLSYCLVSQAQQSQPNIWKDHFYAPDDKEAHNIAQTILAMKNARAITPYVKTGLERSLHDALVEYYRLSAIKERQPDGTYRAIYQDEQEMRKDTDVLL